MTATRNNPTVKYRLIIDVDYDLDLDGDDPLYAQCVKQGLEHNLYSLATRAAGEGLFTGAEPAEVWSWECKVKHLASS